MDRKLIIIFAAGFLVLTIILTITGIISKRNSVIEPDIDAIKTTKAYFANKADIIEGKPILEPMSLEPGATVMDLETRNRKIIPSNKPLPLFPEASGAKRTIPVDAGGANVIMKNLYRESNVYYIPDNEEKNSAPEHYQGIKE